MNEKDEFYNDNNCNDINNSNDNKKQQCSIILPRSSVAQEKILLKRRPQSIDKVENLSSSKTFTKERENIQTIKKCKSAQNIKRVTFNPSVEVINIIEYKNETKTSSYTFNYIERDKGEESKEDKEKKCFICIIY